MINEHEKKAKIAKVKMRQSIADEQRRVEISMLRLLVRKNPKDAVRIVREIVGASV